MERTILHQKLSVNSSTAPDFSHLKASFQDHQPVLAAHAVSYRDLGKHPRVDKLDGHHAIVEESSQPVATPSFLGTPILLNSRHPLNHSRSIDSRQDGPRQSIYYQQEQAETAVSEAPQHDTQGQQDQQDPTCSSLSLILVHQNTV